MVVLILCAAILQSPENLVRIKNSNEPQRETKTMNADDSFEQLLAAIEEGNIAATTKILTEHVAHADSRLKDGVSLLVYSMYCGQREIAELVRDHKKQPLDLFEAVVSGDLARVQELLAVDPKMTSSFSSDGFSPLHLAAFFDKPSVARFLLGQGAKIDQPSTNAQQVTALHSALAKRSHRMIRILVNNGADLNAKQAGGFTALHSAAKHGDVMVVQLLVSQGADISLKSDDGKTASDFASEAGHRDLSETLKL